MTKKICFTLIINVIFSFYLLAQVAPSKYWVMFTDKNNSPYSISNPSAFLSQKAIDRRLKYGIPIQMNDLPVNPWYIDSVRNTGVTVINWSKWFNFVTIETDDTLALSKINSFPFVKKIQMVAKKGETKAQKRQRTQIIDTTIKNKEKKAGSQNNTDNASLSFNLNKTKDNYNYNYGYAENQVTMIACDYLHNLGYRGEGMTIAVLDAGFWSVDTLTIFDSLWINGQILGTRDFVKPGNNVFKESTHGMMVLSIMGGNLPNIYLGTAPKANYWLLRSEDAATEYIIEEGNWAVAAEFADSVGADVINSSLGYTTFYDATQNHTWTELDGNTALVTRAADIAASKGILVVNSAGNSANEPWKYIGTPADADSILTVGAVDENGIYAYFSSVGPTADGRIKPDVCAQGMNTVVASTIGGYEVIAGNGTSFSSPVMAGAITCLWQTNLSLNNMEIIKAVKESASQYNNPDSLLGYGIPNLAAAYLILSNKKILNIDNDNDINVFPNPFVDNIYLLFSSSDTHSVKIEIVDITGKSIRKPELFQINTGFNYINIKDLNNLSEGMYIINISYNKKTFSKKIFKSKR
ncbi:MAG TPA: S8 family serine peptidase [Bacteroidales bacterium]|nr:S8 family serine peptidase [Bacteroidales bacterium]